MRTGEACEVRIELAGQERTTATIHALVADGPFAKNTQVETRPVQIVVGRLTFELPPVCAAVVVVQ